MTRLKLLLTLLAFHGVAANAVETNITILGVRFNESNLNRSQELLSRVQMSWPTSTGTTITLANGGTPLLVPTTLSGTTESAKMNSAKSAAYALNLRNVHVADVILFFTDTMVDDNGFGLCGWAPQDNWIESGGTPGAFNDPDNDGIDLTGAEHSYAAIMATTGGCNNNNTTLSLHEFGHLFGGGHEDNGSGHHWLYSDSHAYLWWFDYPYYFYMRSNLHKQYWIGQNWFQYSDAPGSANNIRALNRTALSVANYRPLLDAPSAPPPYPPPPSPPCSLSTPGNMFSVLRGHCDPYPNWSHYFLTWGDACPSQTTYYRMWVEQPVGNGYLPDAQSSLPFVDVLVKGVSANIRVQACNASSCSALSPDYVTLYPGC